MKTKIFIIIFILSLSLIPNPTFAKEATSTAKAVKAKMEENKKTIVSEVKAKKILVVYNVIKIKLNQRHEILSKIKNKLESRIAQNPMNKDTTAAKAELAKLVAIESKYQLDFKTLQTSFEEANSSGNSSLIIESLKTSSDLIKEDLNNYKNTLKNVTNALIRAPKLEVNEAK
jgi:hypothetical protein